MYRSFCKEIFSDTEPGHRWVQFIQTEHWYCEKLKDENCINLQAEVCLQCLPWN